MSKDILYKIADQSFDFDDLAAYEMCELYDGCTETELFSNVGQIANKILGNRQDKSSRIRAREQFKAVKGKKHNELDIRRFTIPIGLGIVSLDGAELYSRVTVSEHNTRNAPNKQFHPTGIGSVALKVFNEDDNGLEVQRHLVVCQANSSRIVTQINGATHDTRQSLMHMTYLLEQTRAITL